jgi:hypothetical protein
MIPPAPDLPRDPSAYRPRPRAGVGPGGFVAFGVICVLAGAGAVLLAPRLLPDRPGPVAPAVAPVAGLAIPAAPPAVPPPPPPPDDELARLRERIATLESQGARSTEAATAALAAAALTDAAQGSRPFPAEFAALRRTAPDLPELAVLARLAETGAPSRGALAVSFEDVAARAASRSRKPPQDAGLGARLAYAAGKVVTIRQVEDVTGDSPDALLAAAELALRDGDVTGALARLDRLPPKGRAAIAAWREGAEHRAAIDREVAALRARALRDLAPAQVPETAR